MKKTIILISSFLLVIYACNQKMTEPNFKSNVINTMLQEANHQYDSIKGYFNDSIICHFPDKIDTTNISVSENISDKFDVIRLEVTNKIISENFAHLETFYDSMAIACYPCTDTCLLIPNRHIDLINFPNRSNPPNKNVIKKNFRDCNTFSYPVPNFWASRFFDEESECNLSDEFKIYVLEAKPGVFFNKELLAENNYLPDRWESGFSRGVAISEDKKVIIYWLIIW